jgi:hypothetical protein
MWQLGVNNWIKYGWGSNFEDEWSTKSPSLLLDFKVNIKSIPAITAAIEAVNKIVESRPAPYTLMCSGGVDSQAMIWAWYCSGVPFNIVSIKYISDGIWYNEHDLEKLEEFASRHNINVTYKKFDILKFLESDELKQISKENDCHSPQICTHIKISELVESGTIMFSGNFLSQNSSSLNYTIFGLHRYAERIKDTNRNVIPYFFLHTPELAYAFTGNKVKEQLYPDHGFPVILPEKKFTGFEKIKDYYDIQSHRVSTRDKLRFAGRASRRVFDLLFRYTLEDPSRNVDDVQVINITNRQ